jgi:glycosyltransferase involved in cell wall biosynthesis
MTEEILFMNTSTSYCVCILAHNEGKYIARTISAILNGIDAQYIFPIYIYANGCTDRTVEIAKNIASTHDNIIVREISIPSKPNAWNSAFTEQNSEFIIFSDGDIIPEARGMEWLIDDIQKTPGVIIASSRQMPLLRGRSLQQKLVGIMQLPLMQEFLYGGFYVVRRQALVDILRKKGFNGIPSGVTGEDVFLESILDEGQLHISNCRTFYEPPSLKDYLRYLARIRWQNEQIRLILGPHIGDDRGIFEKLIRKFRLCNKWEYICISSLAVVLKYLFKMLFFRKIRCIYENLGPVRTDGANILQSLTRSGSTK